MKKSLLALLVLASAPAAAVEDLSLPGARWLGKASGYVCGAKLTKKVDKPSALASLAVQFETVTTDYSLDNGLLKATFVEDAVKCRYSALVFADNAKQTMKLVESRAFAVDAEASCENGKAMLDSYLAQNNYLYWGHPHHLTVMIEDPEAEAICGKDATTVGVDFVLAGRI